MATETVTVSELFDPEFIESVSRLKILARRVAASGSPAEKRSRQQGAGMEFRDFRPYTPGDDFGSIDWNVYQRLGRVFVRLFEEQRDLPMYLAPDVSSSMFRSTGDGASPRARAGLRAAFALASIGLRAHDSVGVFPFSDVLKMALRPAGGGGRLARVARVLSAQTPTGVTNFAASIRKLNGMKLREGLLVVISDFFDPAGIDAMCEAMKGVRHRLCLVQLVRKTDANPDVSGDLLLQDCETGREEEVSVTPAVLEAYRRSHQRFEEVLASFAIRRRAALVKVDVEEDVVDQLAQLFRTGAYVV